MEEGNKVKVMILWWYSPHTSLALAHSSPLAGVIMMEGLLCIRLLPSLSAASLSSLACVARIKGL